ncbi:cAMP-binding domain of CRP or a regulatory subunit of cAMP-dependent protein kinases [Chitinophaga sp. CF118]|uniref:Crp/Fnr family transcriptional regulator n=1 Tax=Chitinophaga sp. CF118 TaxID=1884367 RepID=UPI0008F1FEBF|nr:Crp/Fnr family transcriptional regulator [Chitinophaga sp. CF118]SFD08591.1 cAMP-binding domain of CRP or a regulatory subunit of cAMP-dependent protein kinases [Chitinophaga sp. CF118]
MEFLEYITSKVSLSEEECLEINNAFETETYVKGTLLIKPGSYSRKVFYTERGLVRTFYHKEDKDITQFFFYEGTFTAAVDSIFYQKPEAYGWETLEQTTVRGIVYEDLQALCDRIPALQKLLFLVAIDILNMFALKLESIQFQTAEQRYITMTEMYPSILLRAPLGHIASYLGITQQTLSVIRGRR